MTSKGKDLLELLIKAQRLLDKCEDELGGFITPAKAIRRDINEAIREYSKNEKEKHEEFSKTFESMSLASPNNPYQKEKDWNKK